MNQDENNALEQAKIDNKIKEVIDRMKFIADASTGDTSLKKPLTIKQGDKTNYNFSNNEYTYTKKDIEEKTPRELISDILIYSGYSNYSSTKGVSSFLPKERDKLIPFYQILNQMEELRVQDKSMYSAPGAYDYFMYRYEMKDSRISSDQEKKFPKHIQFLYGTIKMFWGENMSKSLDPEVLKILEKNQEEITDFQMQPSTGDLTKKLIDSETYQDYLKLYEEEKEEEKKSGGGKNPYSDILDKTTRLEELINSLGEESKQDIKDGKLDSDKENFGQDIDSKYDEKEKGKEEGQSLRYGENLNVGPHEFSGHEEPTLAAQDYLSYEVMYEEIRPYIPFFVSRLQSIMKDNLYKREGGAYRTGKLNTSKLYKFSSGSDKLFKRQIMRRHKDYYVTLLTDMSGSMCSREKNRHAAKATILLSEVLNKVGIPFEIRGFNSYDFTFKRFNESFTWKNRRQLERIITESHGYGAGGNNDGWAVNLATNYLRKASKRTSERILIVMSDGLPAPDYREVTKEESGRFSSGTKFSDFDLNVEVTKTEKDTTCIGVGIAAKHVSEFYKQNVIVDDVSQLPRELLLRLKHNIRRG